MHRMQPLRNFKEKKQTIKGMTNDNLDLGFNGPIESQVQAASNFLRKHMDQIFKEPWKKF